MSKETVLPTVGATIPGVVEVIDPRALDSIDPAAELVRLTDGGTWAEGPVYLPREATVMYSDVRMDRGMRWSAATGGAVWRRPNDHTNGNTLDREGRMVHCEHGNRRVARTELDGTREGLVERYDGKPLNSPNDVVVKSDGTIWFTDPPYGIILEDEGTPAPQEQDACHVFRYDPDSDELTIATAAVIHPNGLAFSPDESLLYVTDTSFFIDPAHNRHIFVFDVVHGRTLGRRRDFTVMQPGLPDGLRVDVNGAVWSSAGDGIHLIDPDGSDLATIHVPEVTSNCVFGGAEGQTLFITASTSLYAIPTLIEGAGVAATVARQQRAGDAS